MFRGSELGSLLLEDLEIESFPVIGFRIRCRKVKNKKSRRIVCIEATNSELCPLVWLEKLLLVRDRSWSLLTNG